MEDIKRRYADILERRADFPALERIVDGQSLAFFDGPGGTQVPRPVIDAMVRYYHTSNANTHGFFVTSQETDRIMDEARETAAAFLGAESPRSISFGANMTTLAFSLSRALLRRLHPGDEVLITQLDHEANRGPWLALRQGGVIVREVAVRPDATLDADDFAAKINERTRLVAMGLSSNAFGTVNDVALARRLTYRVGAWLLVDAVHYAPHFPVDVAAMGVDFLLCSAYKFYGPHVGLLYARDGLLERLQTDRLRTQDQQAPWRIETGTQNHAAIAGTTAAIRYLADLGEGTVMRDRLVVAMTRIAAWEHALARQLHDGLRRIPAITLQGPALEPPRCPTLSFTVEGMDPVTVCQRLAERGICAWDGHFYAIRPLEVLGLLERGGLVRVGMSLYNTPEEVERLRDALADITGEIGR